MLNSTFHWSDLNANEKVQGQERRSESRISFFHSEDEYPLSKFEGGAGLLGVACPYPGP